MTDLNATYLFERPYRYCHNSESWWTAFFSMLVLYKSNTEPSFSLPIKTYTTASRFTRIDWLACAGLQFSDIVVESPLNAQTFNLPEWSTDYQNIKPDLTIVMREQKTVTFIEVKTIGAGIARNLQLYENLCQHLQTSGWKASICYLLSCGHETNTDWRLLERHSVCVILWEDVLLAASETPLAQIFDVPLANYCSCRESG